ncbi:ABC transporter permease, partial [uncultured Clostridium sp.]|uniref:ABC transporter permease n=1 Tax=uncultured Clostridium sp. TaxID=59620 RepID=UPI0026717DAA
ISMAENQLPEIDEVKYYFFNRNDNPGYSEFYDVVKRINSIATVFPICFFIVAVLICLTTMTRMVEENRIEIGTLKALGYSNMEISIKYIIYASLASIIGGILGVIVGFNIFPRVIYTAYNTQYALPNLSIVYYPSYIIQSLVISILCTVGASLLVLKVDLNSTPSTLMRPKAPKSGKRILLERITPIWKRLNFNEKVTFRNLFRYKQRMIMTVFGIAACTAMIITGFGLKDSIGDLTNKQFNKLWKYQATVIFNDNTTIEDDDEYNEKLMSLKGYKNSLNIHQEMVTISKEDINKQNVTLYVPEDKDKFKDFVLLNDRVSGEEYILSDDGAIINEKLAKLLGVVKGDEITFKDSENNSYIIKVNNISESYLSHGIYMSKAYYADVFGKEAKYNSQFIMLDDSNYEDNDIASKLMETNKVINVTMTSYLSKTTNEAMDTLNIVVIILIISAGGLALVVLYNLNNINVSERIRELSTIKVLGFYDHEVTMYILRENFILTALGIIIGMFMGKILHGFVITTAEADNMMLSPSIYATSFIYSIILTIVFSLIVMFMMHRKLKKINMIDALKSNE